MAASEENIASTPDGLDADAWTLNVLNGTIDLRRGILLPHDRADMMTKLAPVVMERSAVCPAWLEFLNQIIPDSEVIRFLQRACGYALTASVREQCLFFLYGSGANGKSTFLEVMLSILGDYAVAAPPGILLTKRGESHPAEFATLFRTRFAVCQEVTQGKQLAESTVKQITGGDQISTRRMRENWWSFDPTHKIFLAANHKPPIKGTDHGIWRRIRLIPFTVTIPEERRDAELKSKLLAERSGILNWILAGCLEWQSCGLQAPAAVLLATEQYRHESDELGGWLDERVTLAGETAIKDLYADYSAYMSERGEKAKTMTAFALELTERGFIERRTKHARHRVGIQLNSTLTLEMG